MVCQVKRQPKIQHPPSDLLQKFEFGQKTDNASITKAHRLLKLHDSWVLVFDEDGMHGLTPQTPTLTGIG